jgi:hypothetical protein
VAAITGFFMAVGPIVGLAMWLVALIGAMLLLPPVHDERALGKIGAFVFFIIFGIPFSYLHGLLPAASAGIAIGTAQLKYGRLSWPLVFLIGAAAGVIDIFVERGLATLLVPHSPVNWQPYASTLDFVLSIALSIVVCTVATFVCWRFVRQWYVDLSLRSAHNP